MPLIIWTQDDSVGVLEIDQQHQKIFGIINNLYDLMQKGSDAERLPIVLKELTDYADYHFTTEEKYFEKFNYQERDEHVKYHHLYKEKIAEFNEKYKGNKNILAFEVIGFLEDWWLKHIRGADKMYTQCFNDHGLF